MKRRQFLISSLVVPINQRGEIASRALQHIKQNADDEMRTALVIGNGAYKNRPLTNPPNDARLVAETLKRLGFNLVAPGPVINANRKDMKRAVRDFGERIVNGNFRTVALFFYAGHGAQANGKNYLIPINAEISDEADLEDEAISADSILARMRFSRGGVNVVILDACRDSPFPASSRSTRVGLASMLGPHGSLIEYSTGPGEIAVDGKGNNSPFSSALAETMLTPNLRIEQVFKRVRAAVSSQTEGKQVPWEASSFIGEFSFSKGSNFDLGDRGVAPSPVESIPLGENISPPPVVDNRVLLLTIQFARDSHNLSTYRQLDNVAKALLDSSFFHGYHFDINGHSTIIGRLGYNIALSYLRAASVAGYLVSRGVPVDRIHPMGYGPLALLDTKHPQSSANNRVEIVAVSN